MMNKTTNHGIKNIIVAVIFACTMLVSSYLVKDSDISQNITLLLICCYTTVFLGINRNSRCRNKKH